MKKRCRLTRRPPFIAAQSREVDMATVKDIMIKKVTVVNEDESLKVVCKALVSQKLSGLPVVDKKGGLVGFISERDIIAAVGSEDFVNMKVSDVMTHKVFSIEEDTPIEKISQAFTDRPYRYIPVTKDGKLVGVVSRKDVINKLLGQYY